MNEEFVLKDTDKNRQLQRDLAEKSQLQMYVFMIGFNSVSCFTYFLIFCVVALICIGKSVKSANEMKAIQIQLTRKSHFDRLQMTEALVVV